MAKEKVQKKSLRLVLFSSVIGVITLLLLSALVSLFCVLMKLYPRQQLPVITLILLGTGALAGGYFAGRNAGSNGYLFGFCTGCTLFLLWLIFSLIFHGEWNGISVLGRGCLFLSLGAFGGMWGVNHRHSSV